MIKFLKKLDILYLFLRYIFYNRIFGSLEFQKKEIENRIKQDKNDENLKNQLENVEITLSDIKKNTYKQGLSFLVSVAVLIFLIIPGVENLIALKDATILALTIISPILSGFIVSWFIITFASIRKEFIFEGFVITFFMLSVFLLSLFTLSVIAWFFLPLKLTLVVYLVVIGGVAGSFKYDMVDLLRTGIDEEGLKFYIRANQKMEKGRRLF